MKKNIVYLTLLAIIFTSCEKILTGLEPENTAKSNFDILWKSFDENYALFEAKQINWDSLYIVYSAKINEQTTESEFWNISSDLILNLDDGHVNIFNKDFSKVVSASKLIRTREPDDFSLELVKSTFILNPKTIGAGYITYGVVKNSPIGYIHIASFAASNTDFSSDWAYDIDMAVKELYNCDALIIDVRNNGGGLIVTENIIASAFIDREITYFYSRQKTGPKHNNFGNPIPISVSPRAGIVPYTKKMAMLTNRFTGSGGEYITQIFKNLAYSTQIGDTTLGAFGEVTNMAQLPNGWTFRYPCTLTITPDGKCPEGIGIIPDVLVENSKQDINSKHDKVLEYAITYLSRK